MCVCVFLGNGAVVAALGVLADFFEDGEMEAKVHVEGLSYIGPVFYASIQHLLGQAMFWVWPLLTNIRSKTLLMTASTCSLAV